MAFYPDELSPIERIRSLGKQTDSLPDISPLKNRRQWKSLVLGKKDMGIHNFATITEEKEEEISSDGSQGVNSNKNSSVQLAKNSGVVTNKKITFPKPRKYITSRVSERKEDIPLKNVDDSDSLGSLSSPVKESLGSGIIVKRSELSNLSSSSRLNNSEPKQVPKVGKSKELIPPAQNFIQNYAFTETPIESQWNESFAQGFGLGSWTKSTTEKAQISKHDTAQGPKPKQEEKKKYGESSKASSVVDATKRDSKGSKKKSSPSGKKPKIKEELPSASVAEKTDASKGKQMTIEKEKALNMKEVVNVYKNLAYGSKEEIKSFIENLSLVKDPLKTENDKNLLSMMNLKALENKIKNFTKKTGKLEEASPSKEKKSKAEKKPMKRNRKAHIEKLARHKVVRVPAVLNKNQSKIPGVSEAREKLSDKKGKKVSVKEPWKYVGMESVLDKTYFVYPSYPPSVKSKNAPKTKRPCVKGVEKPARRNKENADIAGSKPTEPDTKVKSPQVIFRPNLFTGGGLRSHGLSVSGSASIKSISRPSAMTVCTVEFRPSVRQKSEVHPGIAAADQSLLVYLHGTKPIHVKFPYSDKQFSRVKFFRKDERGVPLIKGLGPRAGGKGCKSVSVRNISLPEKLTRVRSLDLLDFDEDIQNISDFLRSQESSDRRRQEEWRGTKKSERDRWANELSEEPDDAKLSFLRQHRQTRNQDNHHQHQHGTSPEILSDSIINDITKSIEHLQYLPDTEDNRKMIGEFFDELDHQIEASRKGSLAFRKFPSPPCPESFRPIPILGY